MNLARPISMPKPIKMPKPIAMPKLPKLAAPKIAHISITPVKSHFVVQHHMTSGPKPVPFVFSDPAKMKTHLARLQNSQWREPERNSAPGLNKILDTQQI